MIQEAISSSLLVVYLTKYARKQTFLVMSKEAIASGNWADGHHSIACNLPLIIFQEKDAIVYYCPALDISGYGSSDEDARKSFEITLDEYFRYTITEQTS